jgi:signal transduction histidine kinase
MFSSIRVRLLFSHLAVIVLAMGLSASLLLSFLSNYFLQAAEESLVAQARITSQALIPGVVVAGPEVQAQTPLSNTIQQQQTSNLALQTDNVQLPAAGFSAGSVDLSYLTQASLQLGTQLETRIRILDVEGSVLLDSWQQDAGMDLSADPLVADGLAGAYASRHDPIGEDALMELVVPAFVDDHLVSVIYLSQPLGDVILVLHELRNRLLLSALIAMALSGVVGLVFSQAITRPLKRLTAAVGTVARGSFDQQVQVQSRDELGQLGRAFNDMTARLQAARQMQVDFVANVSHELRTPMTALKGMVETLQAGAVEDAQVRDRFLKIVAEEVDRLVRLVNDLLLLSEVDAQALELRRQAVDLDRLVQGIAARMKGRAEGQGLDLIVELDPELPMAWADPDKVEQIVINLLDNALKYSPPGGRVVLRAEGMEAKFVRLQVWDEGVGIPAEDLPHLGERFYRTDQARSRAQGGSGLGLAIVRSLVDAHGGRFWLQSEPGRGTLASFSLPVA